jgi:hypothetical protein
MSSLDIRLHELNRKQLIEIIHHLIRCEPGIEECIFLPTSGEIRHVDACHIESQVENILLNMDFHWQASSQAVMKLYPLVDFGSKYLKQDKIEQATTVFSTIITTILEHYEEIYDNESEIAGIVNNCVEGLGGCLTKTDNVSERTSLMEDIFRVFRWDNFDTGGYGMSTLPCTLLIENTNLNERKQVVNWVQNALPITRGAKYGASMRREAGQFILKLLEPNNINETELEQLYIQTDMWFSYLELLLKQKCIPKAIDLIKQAPSDQVFSLANKLCDKGFTTKAVTAVYNHMCVIDPFNHQIHIWLKSKGVELSSEIEVLHQSLRAFQVTRSVKSYKQLRHDAITADRWSQVLELIGAMELKKEKYISVCACFSADKGQVDKALLELGRLKDSAWRTTAADVALSFEDKYPKIALLLYKHLLDESLDRSSKYFLIRSKIYREKIETLKLVLSRDSH